AHGTEHAHAHPGGDARRSLGFGLLHGLAGSAAILVLLVAAAPTRTAQFAYFAAFALGTMIGMLLVSFSLAGLVRLASGRGATWATALHLGSAVISVVVGLLLAGKTLQYRRHCVKQLSRCCLHPAPPLPRRRTG